MLWQGIQWDKAPCCGKVFNGTKLSLDDQADTRPLGKVILGETESLVQGPGAAGVPLLRVLENNCKTIVIDGQE